MMYFVVRTDVTADSGLQRVFGGYDTPEEAAAFKQELSARMRGTFKVFEGSPVPDSPKTASTPAIGVLSL